MEIDGPTSRELPKPERPAVKANGTVSPKYIYKFTRNARAGLLDANVIDFDAKVGRNEGGKKKRSVQLITIREPNDDISNDVGILRIHEDQKDRKTCINGPDE